VWASKRHVDVDRIRQRAAESFDRSFYPAGSSRQLAAIYASGDRTASLNELEVPTLVIHGRDDTLITPGAATATSEAIPGAHLLLVADMGHDLPPQLWPLVVSAIIGFTSIAFPGHAGRL
jgi:pimeloyl-ACP methyl ester carboxylesterase